MTSTFVYNDSSLSLDNSLKQELTDRKPYFVGKDVAEILGYTNASKAIADHVDDEDKLNNETLSSLGQRGGWLINESGLYNRTKFVCLALKVANLSALTS